MYFLVLLFVGNSEYASLSPVSPLMFSVVDRIDFLLVVYAFVANSSYDALLLFVMFLLIGGAVLIIQRH